MKIETLQINTLNPAVYNPRQATEKEIKDLTESIKKFGIVDPIIVNADMTIIGGHLRTKIATNIGIKEIPCVVLDLSKEDEKELNLRLNKNTGSWDFDSLSEVDFDILEDVGFNSNDLKLNIDKIAEPKEKKFCPSCGLEL